MPINFEKNEQATASLQSALWGEEIKYIIPQHALNRPGDASAKVVGGNLSLLYSLAGTPSDIDTTGKILFIEDLDEYVYHIDRMMLQLKRSGKLSGLRGLIVGGMNDMRDNAIPFGKTAEQIILEAVEEYDYPVCFGFPAGHIDDNFALVLGREAELKVNEEEVSLKFTNRK
jgi:muramoyltetrapeptide carboxypeptidase